VGTSNFERFWLEYYCDLYDCDAYKGADVFLPVLGELSLVSISIPCVCVFTACQLYDVDLSYDEECLSCVGNCVILTS
jgi:hypothetical protein